jgi:hypothetical protein
MAYYIQKPSLVDSSVTVYYAGDRRWTDDETQKIKFSTKRSATELMANNDGTNGGWRSAIIVSE